MAAESGMNPCSTMAQRKHSNPAMAKADFLTRSSSSMSHKRTAPPIGRKIIKDRIGNPNVSSCNI